MSESTKEKTISKKIMGCDLGTTNSCVFIREGEKYKVVVNDKGNNTTPSVVLFDKEGKVVAVGKDAKKEAVLKPELVVFEVKRLMGRRFDSPEVQEFRKIAPFKIIPGKNGDAWVKVGEKEYSPQQVSAFILQKMKQITEDNLGRSVRKAVITVPAYFDDAQRQATISAAVIAGFGDPKDLEESRKMIRIINEPTAAALAYGIDKKVKLHTVVVFDLGGGTFDISIIEINGGVFEVKATAGDTYLGGANFDQKIVDWIVTEFKKDEGIDLSKDKMALQRLKEAAENAKHELSSSEIASIKLPFISADASGPKHLDKELTRQLLKELTRDLLEKLVAPCKNCLKDSGVSKVDEVILVGGMTRMPAVQEKVKEIFGKLPNKSVNPDEAVALGAAIQGSVLAGDVEDIIMLDVAPLSLGIEVEGGIVDTIIRRNTTIPTSESRVYSTATDNQPSVFIRVYQGERVKASDNKLLGTFELTGIELAPRGVPQIEVKFDIDANGIVKVSAKDKKTNKEAKITITDSGGISKEEIERMIKESEDEENRAKDEEIKNNVETLNRAQTYCYTFEKQIEEFKSHKNFKEDDPQFQEFKKLYEDLKKLTEEKNYPELKNQLNKIDELMKLSNELMQKMPKENNGNDEEIVDVNPEKKDDDKK